MATVSQQRIVEFKFSVDDAGNFSYNPPENWRYGHTDILRFMTTTGPFTISMRRTDVNDTRSDDANDARSDLYQPFGGDIHGQEGPAGTWIAETGINDGLSDEQRRTEVAAKGFLAHYLYLIKVQRGNRIYKDVHKSGIHMC